MKKEPDYYAVLGVASNSEDVVIQAAYRALMRRYHPDANSSAEAARKSVEINAAYGVLSDPELRAAYDRRRNDDRSDADDKSKSKTHEDPSADSSQPPEEDSIDDRAGPLGDAAARSRSPAAILVYLLFVLTAGGLTIFVVKQSLHSSNRQSSPLMNVDENLTTTDMNATTADMNLPEATGNATDGSSTEVFANADAGLGAAMQPTPPNLSGQATAAVDYSTIEESAQRVAKIIATKGMAGARAYSENCHKAVQAAPSWAGADGCAAFDYAAAYIDATVTTQAGWPKNGYFDFQSDNESDQYAAVGAPSFRTYDRLPKIRAAAQRAGLDAFRTEWARQQTLSRLRESQQPSPSLAGQGNSSD